MDIFVNAPFAGWHTASQNHLLEPDAAVSKAVLKCRKHFSQWERRPNFEAVLKWAIPLRQRRIAVECYQMPTTMFICRMNA